ncbi:uncharacterized protein A1O5_06564 [Cladophialophora psammophila CBS 110553]|uniref:SCP domain-containing protein n=1 Tax=Cladophialophora psammophila CBS 110553 TaxID=1182543 RepID=W9WZK1_9EURO|nr:uncharacterized protein A1O5_06564 [Cladophialophora psammophila CBS 110553]EXJ70495.1 hypothetical protein A1O5_06564 [Cladophialophora psammophila CBS 110553]
MRYHILTSPILFLLLLSSSIANPLSNDVPHGLQPLEKRAVPPLPTDVTFVNTVLARVNAYRALHSAPALTWDTTLAQSAKTAAARCSSSHTPSNPYGENIYSFYLTPKTTVPDFSLWLKKGIDWWYGEVRDYFSWADHSSQYHFTQLVWKSTTKIGCSWSPNQCPTTNGDYYLFCKFQPKGNIAGQFGSNVLDA